MGRVYLNAGRMICLGLARLSTTRRWATCATMPIGLWNAGHPHLAEPMMRAIVRVHQRGQDDDPGRLAGAMRDWSSCLAACGQGRSARETLALANALTGTSARDKLANLPGANGQDGDQG